MLHLTLAQLRIVDAIVTSGSLQAAAAQLNRTHPTLHTALNNTEAALGFKLFDRRAYRLRLTREGAVFLSHARRVLNEMSELQAHAARVGAGEESELRVVIGDLSPVDKMLGLLRSFFAAHRQTRLHLQFETLSAPWQLLAEDKVDLILHHVEHGDARFETVPLGRVALVPVVAPGFLPFPTSEATIERMRELVQCVIRDSSGNPAPRNYFILEGARTCTVSDQLMKKEVIVQGLGWGHMPDYLVAAEIAAGTLLSFANRYFRGGTVQLVAARKAGRAHGPIATRLWDELRKRARSSNYRAGTRPPRRGRR